MSAASVLDAQLRAAGLVIDGVAIVLRDDKTTWRVDFTNPPSAADQTTAATIIAGFDPVAADNASADALNIGNVVSNPRMAKVLFAILNAIRGLQNKAPITADQLQAWVASL